MFFFAGDCSSPPNGRTNVSAKDFLQIRDDAMPNAVAERIKILVRCVLAKFDPMFAHINVDLFAPDTEKRPHNDKIDIVDPARCNLPHPAQACSSRAAKEIDQKSFDEVVGVMPKKDRFAFSASGSFSEKFVAGFARCGFDRDLLFRSQSADIRGAKLEINARIDLCRASAALARSPTWQAERLPYKFPVEALD